MSPDCYALIIVTYLIFKSLWHWKKTLCYQWKSCTWM